MGVHARERVPQMLEPGGAGVKPILFNTEMVCATLDGRKTATRRVVRPQPPSNAQLIMGICSHGDYAFDDSIGSPGPDDRRVYMAPYSPGDTLYVREKWRVSQWSGPGFPLLWFEFADGTRGESVEIKNRDMFERLVTQSREDARKANCAFDGVDYVWAEGEAPTRWRPSIHMPKEAARIFLRVVDVRVERLQEITDEGARAEGVSQIGEPRAQFAVLWETTIKPEMHMEYGWAANPWVWVIEFERCERPKEARL